MMLDRMFPLAICVIGLTREFAVSLRKMFIFLKLCALDIVIPTQQIQANLENQFERDHRTIIAFE